MIKLSTSLAIKAISPRAHSVLFTFLRPKGLNIVSIVEFYAEFENAFLKKNPDGTFFINRSSIGVPSPQKYI